MSLSASRVRVAPHLEVILHGLEPRQYPGEVSIKRSPQSIGGCPVAIISGADWRLPEYLGYMRSTSLGWPYVPLSQVSDLASYLVFALGLKTTISLNLRPFLG